MTLEKRGESLHPPKMNYWLTTINMLQAQRPAYNTSRSIRVFIMYGYWSFMKEWIIFHIAYVSTKKKSNRTVKACRRMRCSKGACTEPGVSIRVAGLHMDMWRQGAQGVCDGTHCLLLPFQLNLVLLAFCADQDYMPVVITLKTSDLLHVVVCSCNHNT